MGLNQPDAPSTGLPSGPAGGDLAGTYPNPDVAKIDGITLGGTTPDAGDILTATGPTAADWADPAASSVVSVFTRSGAVTAQSGDYTAAQVTGAAPLASPTFTGTVAIPNAAAATSSARIGQLSPLFTITSGALPTLSPASGTALQISTTRDVETHTSVTMNSLIATVATCKVEISPDNSTFSTLCIWTEPVGVAFAGTIIDVVARVPAGWYLKLTVAQAVLGTLTYY